MRTKRDMPVADAILLAAKYAFSEAGYELVSMDDVAARAATTKRTVYNHFSSKERLFRAVIENSAVHFLAALDRLDHQGDVLEELTRFCARFVELTCWTGSVGIQRVVLAEANRFPDLARMLHLDGFARAETALAAFLEEQVEKGRLGIADPRESAVWLLGMVSAAPRFRTLFNGSEPLPGPPEPTISPAVDEQAVRRAVAAFLDHAREKVRL